MIYFGLPLILISNTARFELMSSDFYTDISCLGGVFVKNTEERRKISRDEGNLVSRLVFFANTPPKHDISV